MEAIPLSAIRQRQAVRDRLTKVFDEAAKERKKRETWVKDPYDNDHETLGWIVYERDKMFDAVTRERALLGKDPLPMKNFIRVENCAKGHVDYALKLCLYATELVFDDWRGP